MWKRRALIFYVKTEWSCFVFTVFAALYYDIAFRWLMIRSIWRAYPIRRELSPES